MKDRFMNQTLSFLEEHGIRIVEVYTSLGAPEIPNDLLRFEIDDQRRAPWKLFPAPRYATFRKATEVNGTAGCRKISRTPLP